MSDKRLAVISVMIEDRGESHKINSILSQFGDFIVGRMGLPYREKSISVICLVLDAPAEVINSVTGKIGMIAGVTAKTLMSKF